MTMTTFNSIQELQDFLAWCSANNILYIEVGDVKATLLPAKPAVEEEDAFLVPPQNGGW
jgi:hypothetical protein